MTGHTWTRRKFSQIAYGGGLASAALTPARGDPIGQITVSSARILAYGDVRVPCVLGRTGIAHEKTEGDGTTPAGKFPLRRLFYRGDRIKPVQTALPARALSRLDSWCDDPSVKEYNTFVQRPFASHSETLWRQDHLYDVLIVIGYNDAPITLGRGSAIFLHIAPPGLTATDGCVAIALAQLLALARACSTETTIEISGP